MSDMLVGILGLICIIGIVVTLFILFSNENGTRYEANFSFWWAGMERGVAALR